MKLSEIHTKEVQSFIHVFAALPSVLSSSQCTFYNRLLFLIFRFSLHGEADGEAAELSAHAKMQEDYAGKVFRDVYANEVISSV